MLQCHVEIRDAKNTEVAVVADACSLRMCANTECYGKLMDNNIECSHVARQAFCCGIRIKYTEINLQII